MGIIRCVYLSTSIRCQSQQIPTYQADCIIEIVPHYILDSAQEVVIVLLHYAMTAAPLMSRTRLRLYLTILPSLVQLLLTSTECLCAWDGFFAESSELKSPSGGLDQHNRRWRLRNWKGSWGTSKKDFYINRFLMWEKEITVFSGKICGCVPVPWHMLIVYTVRICILIVIVYCLCRNQCT